MITVRQIHTIKPVFNTESRVLILGTFPSVRSREEMFFYAHPRNRFWAVLAGVLGCPVPRTIQEKTSMLLEHRIALWDVVAGCEIEGSSDARIRGVEANDLSLIIDTAPVRAVFTNGGTAHRLYRRYCLPVTGLCDTCLPSTSPANARMTQQMLAESWSAVARALED